MWPQIGLFCAAALACLLPCLWLARRRTASRVQLGWKRAGVFLAVLVTGPVWFFASEPWMQVRPRAPVKMLDPSGNIVADVIGGGIGASLARGFEIVADMIVFGIAGWIAAVLVAWTCWRRTPDAVRYSAEWYQ